MQDIALTAEKSERFGWMGRVDELLRTGDGELLAALEAASIKSRFPASASQIAAWKSCAAVLRPALIKASLTCSRLLDWSIVFEYELPRERGRRPDVVLLGADTILVLEFKDYAQWAPAHRDQVAAYARDLRHYHAKSHGRQIVPILVLTKSVSPQVPNDEVVIVSGRGLAGYLSQAVNLAPVGELIHPAEWAKAEYAPLPTLIEAARRIFKHEPLPSIRRAQSAGIPWTLKYLEDVADRARRHGERHLVLVTGVPGAGKTLVGLQFVYQRHFSSDAGDKHAVFLSGNDPLVKVLQHALQSSAFVQDVHGFLRQYGGTATELPREHIWVYDEAQRAWDAERVALKRGHSMSEPEDFLEIGARIDGWALMVGLVGEGQEIHLGEEAGLNQWNAAIEQSAGEWIVHCPPKIESMFSAAHARECSPVLDLTQSLRSHIAEDVQRWITAVLDFRIDEAKQLAPAIEAQGFHLYITRDLDDAKTYLNQRYAGEPDKRFGLIASSKARNLPPFGVNNVYTFTRNMREGPWYNDPPESRASSCQLVEVATEFACQGLELDMPVVCWGSDLRVDAGLWKTPRVTARNTAKNPRQLRINSYRVLLSRGRDGVILFVPREHQMEETFATLRAAGARVLMSDPAVSERAA